MSAGARRVPAAPARNGLPDRAEAVRGGLYAWGHSRPELRPAVPEGEEDSFPEPARRRRKRDREPSA